MKHYEYRVCKRSGADSIDYYFVAKIYYEKDNTIKYVSDTEVNYGENRIELRDNILSILDSSAFGLPVIDLDKEFPK